MTEKRKVVICGTHPSQFNGYSKIVFEICNGLSTTYREDLDIYVYGFQNFYDDKFGKEHVLERSLPNVKEVYDVFAHENPKRKGFGEELIVDYLRSVKPDIVIIYNDLIVITSLIQRISKMPERSDFKLIPYIDLVYTNEKNELLKYIHDQVDGAITFTDHWTEELRKQNFTKSITSIPHGFNPTNHFPIDKKVARLYFGVDQDAVVVVNLNRNQPRKRWDICIISFIKFISGHLDTNVKLLIGTTLKGAWDIMDIIIHECRKNNVSLEHVQRHIIMISNPQQLTDKEVNILYNVGDIGFNTCDGEGFGLCNFEQAGVGVPQIVSRVGGFKDFFNKTNSVSITPKWSYYVDKSRDVVGGEAQVCDVNDFVKALEYYVFNENVRKNHGALVQKQITSNYKWTDVCKSFYDLIITSTNDVVSLKRHRLLQEECLQVREPDNDDLEEIDIEKLIKQRFVNRANTLCDEPDTEQLNQSIGSSQKKGNDEEADYFIIEA
jgi:glycosyltransferase involved in cell wall biosynthesis